MVKKLSIIIISILILAVLIFIVINKVNDNKKYQIPEIRIHEYLVLNQDGKYGVIDKNGNIIITPEYTDVKIPNPQKAVFVCYEDNGIIKILNQNGEEKYTEYEKVEPIRLNNVSSSLMYEKTVLKYYENGKYGLIDFEGKEVTNPIYDDIQSLAYREGNLLIQQNKKYGIIDPNGKVIIKPEYDNISSDNYNINIEQSGYIVENITDEGYRYGYINNDGKMILKTEFNELSRVTNIENKNDIYFILAQNGRFGVNRNNKNIINYEYQSISYDNENKIWVVEKSKKYGIADLDGNIIIPVEYDEISIDSDHIYAQNAQEQKVYDAKGNEENINFGEHVINTSNDNYKIFGSKENLLYGVKNSNEEIIIEEKYDYIEYLFDKYFIASDQSGKLGIIDDEDNIVLEFKFDSINKIENSDNLIQTLDLEKNTVGIYGNQIQEICILENGIIENKQNYIRIYNENDSLYFDKSGNQKTNKELLELPMYANKKDGKWGFEDKEENVKVEYEYDRVTEFNEYGFAGIQKDGKWGVIDKNGEIILDPIYEFDNIQEPQFIGKYYQMKYDTGEIYYSGI